MGSGRGEDTEKLNTHCMVSAGLCSYVALSCIVGLFFVGARVLWHIDLACFSVVGMVRAM